MCNIAYTYGLVKECAGKEIVKKLGEWSKKNKMERLVTLSLTYGNTLSYKEWCKTNTYKRRNTKF